MGGESEVWKLQKDLQEARERVARRDQALEAQAAQLRVGETTSLRIR